MQLMANTPSLSEPPLKRGIFVSQDVDHYSLLRTSTGFCLEALKDGKTPDKTVKNKANPRLPKINQAGKLGPKLVIPNASKLVFHSVFPFTRAVNTVPIIEPIPSEIRIPIVQPIIPSEALSITKIEKISVSLAPNDFKIPISFCLSRTEMVITFTIPKTEAIKAINPKPASTTVRTEKAVLIPETMVWVIEKGRYLASLNLAITPSTLS